MKNSYSLKHDVYPLVILTIPLALTGMVQSITWFFETLFLSRLGPETLAAGSLVSWLFGTLAVILFGVLSSINILVAHKHGAKDATGIAEVARDGLILALLISFPTAFLLWNISPIFLLFGQPESVVLLARPYVHALTLGLPAIFLTVACLEVVIGAGHARVVLVISIIAVILNVIASYVLIFGQFGFPALGIAGAGWGITISYWGTLLVLAVFVYLNKVQRAYFSHIFIRGGASFFAELVQIGAPTGVMYCVEVGFFFALTLAMGVLGTEIQAANQVALQYLGLMMSTMFAVAQAITVRMGHSIGAGDLHAAEKASVIGTTFAVIFISLVGIVYWLFPEALISIDFDVHNPANATIVSVIVHFLSLCAIFQIVETIRIALFGSLRGLKDTRFTMMASIISFWFVALPIGYLLAMFAHMGGAGYWWGMIIGASVSVILLQWRFRKRMLYFHRLSQFKDQEQPA